MEYVVFCLFAWTKRLDFSVTPSPGPRIHHRSSRSSVAGWSRLVGHSMPTAVPCAQCQNEKTSRVTDRIAHTIE